MSKLTDKQQAKVREIVASASVKDAETAITVATATPSATNLKAARKALVKQVRILDKALVIHGLDLALDLALDEAKELIEKKSK